MKKTDSLGFKIGLIFFIFNLIILILCGLTTYSSQMRIYKAIREDSIRSAGENHAALMAADGEDPIRNQSNSIEHYADADIPIDAEIADANTEILHNTLKQFGIITVIMAAGTIVLVILINRRFFSKIVRLEANVRDYTISRDPAVAEQIRRDIRGRDEITSLSEGIINLITGMQEHIRGLTRTCKEADEANDNAARMNDLAQKDSLTGIRNHTAYEQEMETLQSKLENGLTDFGIAEIDLNDLKGINDTCGHDKGNLAVQKLSNLICQVFKHSKVFRTGGDEFTVILENEDFKNRKARVGAFKYQLSVWEKDKNLPEWEKISAAIGVAVYDSQTDTDVNSVSMRANELMHENKKEMKGSR